MRRERGQALVENALTLTILLMIILCGIAAIQTVGVHYAVGQAVRVAVHQAALRGSTGGLEYGRAYSLADARGPVAEAARLALQGSVFARPEEAQIIARCATDPCRRYQEITVEIRYEGSAWAPMPPFFERISARRSATRIAEQDSQDA